MSRILMTIVKTFAYGSNRMMLQYASALTAAGHDVTVAFEQLPHRDAAATGSILPELEQAEIATVHIPQLVRSVVTPGGGEFRRVVRQRGFDLLISNQLRDTAATMFVAHSLGLPGVAFVQGPPFFQGSAPIRAAKRWLYGRAVREYATRIIGVGPAVKQCLIEQYGINPAKCAVVMNGVHADARLTPDAAARTSVLSEFNLAVGDFVLLTIGRFDPVKGVDILIRAVHQAVHGSGRRLRLLVAAEANSKQTAAYRAGLETMVRDLRLDDQVSFIGYRNDCHRLLQAADCFVLPSRSEGFPLTLLEAFAAECPVIMTDFALRVPGFRQGELGLDVPVDDIAALAHAIRSIMMMSESQRRKGTGSRTRSSSGAGRCSAKH